MAIQTYLSKVWSATDFGDSELSEYAEAQLCDDTRIGLQTMAGLSLFMQLGIATFSWYRGLGSLYVSTSILFGLLSLHVLISARFLREVRALQTLGMAFLTIGALSLTILAHRAGELHMGMMAATVMLFIAIPLVPWAVRETGAIIGIAYLLLTSSLIAVPGRFSTESLWVLQLLVLGAAIVVLVITGRNTFIRKQDLRARFDLVNAHEAMELLSMQDHLTGAWNRRYLDENFSAFAEQCRQRGETLQVAVLDIDDFKGINDLFGHQVGDRILISVADTFVRHLGNRGRLIRLGGDEFQILYCGDDLDTLIDSAIGQLQDSTIAAELTGEHGIGISAGIAVNEPGEPANLEALYKTADRALYLAKQNRPAVAEPDARFMRTGKWKL